MANKQPKNNDSNIFSRAKKLLQTCVYFAASQIILESRSYIYFAAFSGAVFLHLYEYRSTSSRFLVYVCLFKRA